MSEEQTTDIADATATETPAPVDEQPTGDTTSTDDAAEAAKWKALARQHEARAKANADKAQRLDEIEEANKSEQQKLADVAAAAEQRAADTAAELARMKAAVKHGLTEDDLDLLGTGSPEEIEQRAERLAARLANATPKAASADGQGKTGDAIEGPKQLTRGDLTGMTPQEINVARSEGRLNDLLGVKT